jgi:Sec-independent protein translocase protein TatA
MNTLNTAKRRLFLSIPALLLGASTLLAVGPAVATEQGQQRQDARDTRQDTRSDSREAKVDCRQADQQSNPECRQDKRDAKQDGRESARDTKY